MKLANGLISKKLRNACQQNNVFTQALVSCLSPDFAPHVAVTNYQYGVLTISVDSSAWMTTLRFHSNSILSNLCRETGVDIKSINIRVIPARVFKPFEVRANQKRGFEVSEVTAKNLTHVGESTVDLKLSEALLRLAQRAKSSE